MCGRMVYLEEDYTGGNSREGGLGLCGARGGCLLD